MSSKKSRRSMDALRFCGAGLTFGLEMAVFAWVGNWADGRFGTEPWLVLTGVVVGLVVATTMLLRAVRRYEERGREEHQ